MQTLARFTVPGFTYCLILLARFEYLNFPNLPLHQAKVILLIQELICFRVISVCLGDRLLKLILNEIDLVGVWTPGGGN